LAIAADARFALEGPGDDSEDEEGGSGGGGGGIPVRVEKGVVHYGDPAMALAKGTALLVTLPRTDDQYVATLQSFNQLEVRFCVFLLLFCC
jgi:hypothetical protein